MKDPKGREPRTTRVRPKEPRPTQAYVALAQLVVLAFVDPTGLLAFLGAEALSTSSQLLLAKHSREHEDEADATGLQICASACFDPIKGKHFMTKLADSVTGHGPASFFASHPSSHDRIANLDKLVTAMDRPTYANHCAAVQANLRASQARLRRLAQGIGIAPK